MSGPTNAQVAVAHVDRSPEAVIRQTCREQGCTCGDDLQIRTRPLRSEERPEGTEDYGRATGAEVSHRLDCPLLMRANGS